MKKPLIVLVALLVLVNAVTLLYLRTHAGAALIVAGPRQAAWHQWFGSVSCSREGSWLIF